MWIMIRIPAKVLEAKGTQTFAVDGETIQYRHALVRLGDAVVKFKVALDVDLSKFLDKECVLECDLRPSQNMFPSLKVVGVSAK